MRNTRLIQEDTYAYTSETELARMVLETLLKANMAMIANNRELGCLVAIASVKTQEVLEFKTIEEMSNFFVKLGFYKKTNCSVDSKLAPVPRIDWSKLGKFGYQQ